MGMYKVVNMSIRKILWLFFVVVIMGIESITLAGTISGIVGANIDSTGVVRFPTNFMILCAPGVDVNCPKTFHPSWVDSQRFWGEDGAGGHCVTSLDGGVTWVLCATQPFSGVALRVASSSDGSVLAAASVSGSCVIRRSTDNAATWATVFTDSGVVCTPAVGAAQVFYCSRSGGVCHFAHNTVNVNSKIYTTVDNGVTFVKTTLTDTNYPSVVSMAWDDVSQDGTLGIAGGISQPVTTINPDGTGWVKTAKWPLGLNCGDSGAGRYSDFNHGLLCRDVVNNNYRQLDSDGNIKKTFTPTGALVLSSASINGFEWATSIVYLVGCNTSGNQRFWITTDNFTSFIVIADVSAICGMPTFFRVGSSLYISVAGTTGGFYRISM
jgi:hypothetical protein